VSKRRVVVTGLGLLSPLGGNVADSWKNILDGKSGIGPITRFDTTNFPSTFGGAVKGFDVDDYMSRKDAKKMDPFIHYGVAKLAVKLLSDETCTATCDINHFTY